MKIPYYYDPPESLNMVNAPGEVCDLCGRLDGIAPSGTMMPLPMTDSWRERGCEEGNIHGHKSCVIDYLENLKNEVAQIEQLLAFEQT